MNGPGKFFTQNIIDQALPRDWRQPFKLIGDNKNPEMGLAAFRCASVACMEVGFILDLKLCGREAAGDFLVNGFRDRHRRHVIAYPPNESRLYRAPRRMARKEYKPRLGFDIRVKPPKDKDEKPPAWSADPGEQTCEAPDCAKQAACSLPKSPREPRKRAWFCLSHAREHNKNWNYFDGLSTAEAKAAREANLYGGRPTWSMGKNDRARAASNARGPADMADAFGIFSEKDKRLINARGHYRQGKQLTKLQVKSFETLALPFSAPSAEIRRRYAELVRRFHPDSNEGDRSAEEQLSEVVKSHTILKKAGFV